MLKERTELIRNVLYVIDLLIITAAFFTLYFIFAHFKDLYSLNLFPGTIVVQRPHTLDLYMHGCWLALIAWAALLKARGEYHLRLQTYSSPIRSYLVNGFIFFVFFTSFSFILKMDFMSRLFMATYTAASTLLLLLNRALVMAIAHQIRRRGYNYRNLLLVGTSKRAQDFMQLIAKHREWGYRIIGLLDQEPEKVGKSINGYPVIGTLNDLQNLLEKNVVDEVVFVIPRN